MLVHGMCFFICYNCVLLIIIEYYLIFINMVKKRNLTSNIIDPEPYILPSKNDEMRNFVNKFKVDMMEHIVSNIKFAIENKLSIVEVFQFKNSSFIVTINEKEFETNLSHIIQYYKDNQIYELCPKVEQLLEILKRNINEKENPEDSGPDSTT